MVPAPTQAPERCTKRHPIAAIKALDNILGNTRQSLHPDLIGNCDQRLNQFSQLFMSPGAILLFTLLETDRHFFHGAAQNIVRTLFAKFLVKRFKLFRVQPNLFGWFECGQVFHWSSPTWPPRPVSGMTKLTFQKVDGQGSFPSIFSQIQRIACPKQMTDPVMPYVKPLPQFLVQRYHGWKATSFSDNKVWYRKLAASGQSPRAMIISCCDSRVHAASIFGADAGEFFIHRNVANLVPAYAPDGDHHGTSAAIEYAVTALEVSHILVLGHSQCGGVKGCLEMCEGRAPELEQKSSFVGRWMDILRPGFERVKQRHPEDGVDLTTALEKESVIVAIENLMTFPFVKDAVDAEMLTLHGLWMDISAGSLEALESESREFVPV